MIKRLYPIVFICLLAAPLLLAQDSESNNSQIANIGGAWQLSWQGRGGSQQATIQIQQDGSSLSGTFQPQGAGGGQGGRGGGQGNHSWSGVRQQGKSGRQSEPEQNQDEDDEYGL
ncbi:MAG: hypothetical protein WB660_17530 [Candidatus Sulfotelmatobacter sp.]